jgi:hypothetical protein
MDSSDRKPTPWAPAHLDPVFCCCHHWDAWECSRSRYGFGPDYDNEDDRCDCCCHDRDIDDDDTI